MDFDAEVEVSSGSFPNDRATVFGMCARDDEGERVAELVARNTGGGERAHNQRGWVSVIRPVQRDDPDVGKFGDVSGSNGMQCVHARGAGVRDTPASHSRQHTTTDTHGLVSGVEATVCDRQGVRRLR